MPSIETKAQNFKILIRVRTLCLALMIFLLWWAEGTETSSAVIVGWKILIFAGILGLVFVVLGKIKKITGILLPFVLLLDSVLVGLWVSVSGGPVSYYIPFFMLTLISAIMVLPARTVVVVILGILGVFIGTIYLDFIWNLPASFEAGKINFISDALEKLPPADRETIYHQQTVRWFFFFVMMIATGVLLMRQVWLREERVRIREKALEQKRHLIQMGELTGRIAHGVNTPLGLISGNLELLMAETRKGSSTLKQLTQIDQYVQRAIRTVRDILDFSRQSMSEIKPVSLLQVIQAVTSAVQAKLKKVGGTLILDVDPKLPDVTGYPEGLFQVLLNLLENAVDSIRDGGIVTLSAHFQYRSLRLSAHDRRGEIKIVVRDTGRGIAADELKRIFEPFYSTKGFGKGTGLGLAIVKRIVDEHQGSIKVESRLSEGTVFTLLLPTDGLAREESNHPDDFYYNEPITHQKETSE